MMGRSYKKRWFVLNGAMLTYFADEGMAKPLGSVNLKACTQFGAADPSKHTSSSVARFAIYALEIATPSRSLVIIPESGDDQRQWTRQVMRQVPQSALSDTLPVLKAGPRKGDGPDSDDSDAGESKRSGGSKKQVRLKGKTSTALVPVDSDDEDGGAKVPLAGVLRQQNEQQEEIDELRQELAQLRTEASRRASNASSIGAPLLISDSDGDTSGISVAPRGFLDSEDEDDDEDEKLDPTCCCGLCCRCCGTWNWKVLYLAVANVIVLALGLIILIMAVVALKNKAQFEQILPILGIYVLLGTGIVTVFAAPGGTFCATRHKSGCGKMGLVVYCGILLVLVLA